METEISEAVKELRREYGEAQQAFSTRLGMSMASIANYETGTREPDGASAIKLARAAAAKGRLDLQFVFDKIIRDSLGGLVAPIQNEDEHRKIRALQFVLYDPRFEHLRQPLAAMLAPVEAHLRRVEKRLAESSKGLK
jgi:transcriptional regulator with XRE-family HTH domain